MVLRGLVFEGLAEKKRSFVVDLVPVFAVAHVQGGFNVAVAFLVPQVDLQAVGENHKVTRGNKLGQSELACVEFLCHPTPQVTLWLTGAVLEQ